MSNRSSLYFCSRCGKAGPYSIECPGCFAIHTMAVKQGDLFGSSVAPKIHAPEPSAMPHMPIGPTIQPIQARIVPLNRIKTGLVPLDEALNGGLVEGSSTVLGGDWGVGKSTLALRIASALLPETTLYVQTEENREQIEDRATRTGQALGVPLLCTSSIAEVLSVLTAPKAGGRVTSSIRAVIIDSLNNFDEDYVQVSKDLVKVSRKEKISILACAQVVKDGTIAGPNSLGHLFDTILMLEKTRTDTRELVCEKSRYAPSPRRYPLLLTETGWTAVETTQKGDSTDTGPNSPNRTS